MKILQMLSVLFGAIALSAATEPKAIPLKDLNLTNEVFTAQTVREIVDYTEDNAVLTNTIAKVAPTPGDYAAVSNAAMNALSRAESKAGFTKWTWTSTGPDVTSIEWHNNNWVAVYSSGLYPLNPPNAEDPHAIELHSEDVHAYRTRLPTMADLGGKASTNDVQLTPVYSQTPTFSEWTTEPAGYAESIEWESGLWCIPGTDNALMPNAADINTTSLVFDGIVKFTATRTRTDVVGYTLGSQTDKVLASTNMVDYTEDNAVLTNTIAKVAPTPGDYSAVSNAAMNALSRAEAEAGFTEWEFSDGNVHTIVGPVETTHDGWFYSLDSAYPSIQYFSTKAEADAALVLTFSGSVTATRVRLPTMADIPTNNTQLVNGANYVTDSITNGLASSNDYLKNSHRTSTSEKETYGYIQWLEAGVSPPNLDLTFGEYSTVDKDDHDYLDFYVEGNGVYLNRMPTQEDYNEGNQGEGEISLHSPIAFSDFREKNIASNYYINVGFKADSSWDNYTEYHIGYINDSKAGILSLPSRSGVLALSNDVPKSTSQLTNDGSGSGEYIEGRQPTDTKIWTIDDCIYGTDVVFTYGSYSESQTPNNNISDGAYIYFRPSELGMGQNETIQSITLTTRSNSIPAPWPGNFTGYLRIMNEGGTANLAESEVATATDYNQDVEFKFKNHVLLTLTTKYLVAIMTNSASVVSAFPLRLITGSDSQNLYVNGNTTWRPVMSAKYYLSVSGALYNIVNAIKSGEASTMEGTAGWLNTIGEPVQNIPTSVDTYTPDTTLGTDNHLLGDN